MVKSAQYCAKLEGDLKHAIRSKHRTLVTNVVGPIKMRYVDAD